MASYQRVALFIFFDAMEKDLVAQIRSACNSDHPNVLTEEERQKAALRLQRRDTAFAIDDDFDLLHGLDIGEKYDIILRHKNRLSKSTQDYYISKKSSFNKAIPIRNATMHGRPLTTEQYSFKFSIAQEFLSSPSYWRHLNDTYKEYAENPKAVLSASVLLLDDGFSGNNLPIPDYDDTGFLPRPALEKELKRKILGRYPVVTVLGDGGNGKTALTLQTLYGLLNSNDHDFDALVCVSAISNKLTTGEISRIENAITHSLGLFEEVAELFEPGDSSPLERVSRLLENNRVLLNIDNLETVLDETLRDFASDIPGESKVLFTSRVPLGADLSVQVPEMSELEGLTYLRRLIEAYDVPDLRSEKDKALKLFIKRLRHKPLLIKWFAIGVSQGM